MAIISAKLSIITLLHFRFLKKQGQYLVFLFAPFSISNTQLQQDKNNQIGQLVQPAGNHKGRRQQWWQPFFTSTGWVTWLLACPSLHQGCLLQIEIQHVENDTYMIVCIWLDFPASCKMIFTSWSLRFLSRSRLGGPVHWEKLELQVKKGKSQCLG